MFGPKGQKPPPARASREEAEEALNVPPEGQPLSERMPPRRQQRPERFEFGPEVAFFGARVGGRYGIAPRQEAGPAGRAPERDRPKRRGG